MTLHKFYIVQALISNGIYEDIGIIDTVDGSNEVVFRSAIPDRPRRFPDLHTAFAYLAIDFQSNKSISEIRIIKQVRQ